jgi:hypothetical protein
LVWTLGLSYLFLDIVNLRWLSLSESEFIVFFSRRYGTLDTQASCLFLVRQAWPFRGVSFRNQESPASS